MTRTHVLRAIAWLLMASALGFLVPAVFSSGLHLTRGVFLVPYVAVVGSFLLVFFRKHPVSNEELTTGWKVGLLATLAASVFLVGNVVGQPPSHVPAGAELAGAVLWMGLVYGAVDGLFLNVVPVLIVWRAWPSPSDDGRSERVLRGLAALGASLAVTAAYHVGYVEFRGLALFPVLLGNGVITATYLLSGSPLAPVLTHVVMHVAAVLHGMETTLQLPPHY